MIDLNKSHEQFSKDVCEALRKLFEANPEWPRDRWVRVSFYAQYKETGPQLTNVSIGDEDFAQQGT